MRLTRYALWPLRYKARRRSGLTVDPDRQPSPIPPAVRASCRIRRTVRGQTEVVTLTPRATTPTATMLYLHGGTYSSPISTMHWKLIGNLLNASGARVIVPLYLRTPEHTLDDALPDLTDIYRDACSTSRLVLAGDSSGAGLALALAQVAARSGDPAAAVLVLFSPWVDVTVSSPESLQIQHSDPVIRLDPLRTLGAAWAGHRSTSDPLVSPLHARLEGLPPAVIFQGGHDILTPDVDAFVSKARREGMHVDYVLEEAGFHVYPMACWTVEARRAIAKAAAAITGNDFLGK